ncbi:MAG: transposase [Chloroflexi bacterium]|nr:transposase [Chloroflexota bacterium]
MREDATYWRGFLQSLVSCGLRGVQLTISGAHEGLEQAIRKALVGTSWQRCRVKFTRNVLSRVARSAQATVTATVRTMVEQPDRAAAETQLRQVCTIHKARFPAVVRLIEEAEAEILPFFDFPAAHRRQIASTNPLERLKKELKRRSHVVSIFPSRAAVLRLFGAVLAEQNGEWLVGRHCFSEASMRQLARSTDAEAALPKEVSAASLTARTRWLFPSLDSL